MKIESSSELKKLLAEEVSKYKGIAIPVRVSWPHRVFTKTLPLTKLHPNPAVEFCFPEIGPNDSIISGYVKDFCRFREDNMGAKMVRCNALEPIQVEKIKPNGYMILNGHHRWAAAMRAGQDKMPWKL